MNELSTQELKQIISGVAFEALKGFESKSNDEVYEAALDELKSREQERGEKVRLSNLEKNTFGEKAYICGYKVDGIITSKWYETDATKAKSYPRVK